MSHYQGDRGRAVLGAGATAPQGTVFCPWLRLEQATASVLSSEYARFVSPLRNAYRSNNKYFDILYPLFLYIYYEVLIVDKYKALDFLYLHSADFEHDEDKSQVLGYLTLQVEDVDFQEVKSICQPVEIQHVSLSSEEERLLTVALDEADAVYLACLVLQRIKVVAAPLRSDKGSNILHGLLSDNDNNTPFADDEMAGLLNAHEAAKKSAGFSASFWQVVLATGSGPKVTTADLSCDLTLAACTLEDYSIRVHSLVSSCSIKGSSVARSTSLSFPPSSSREICVDDNDLSSDSALLRGHVAAPLTLAFTREVNYLLSGDLGGRTLLWDISKQTSPVSVYQCDSYPVWGVVGHPLNASLFATSSHSRCAMLWSTDRQIPLRVFSGHLTDVDRCCFHPNCSLLVTAGLDCTVRLWDLNSGCCVRLIGPHTRGSITALSCSHDGQLLATGGDDRHLRVYELVRASGTLSILWNSKKHNETVSTLTWSPCDRFLVSGDYSGRVVVWSRQSGTVLSCTDMDQMESCYLLRWNQPITIMAVGSQSKTSSVKSV